MGTCRGVSLLATIAVGLGVPRIAAADPKSEIQTKIKEAMESYDLMDYDAAKKLLNQAVATAKKARLDKDPVVAKAYLDLGIVAFAVPDQEAAKVSFLSAVQIDPKIQIDAAYKSAEMAKLLDEARGEVKSGGAAGNPGGEDAGGGGDCSSVTGLQHDLVDTAKAGAPQKMEAMLGSDVKPAKVSLMYRVEGASEFTEVKMTASGCKYTGQIPAAAMKGGLVHYYIAAYDKNGRVIVGKGSQGSPNIIEISGSSGTAGGGDEEDPLHKGGRAKTVATTDSGGESGGEVGKGAAVSGPKHDHVMLAVSVGTGGEYVNNDMTEGGNVVKTCCFGSTLLVVTPELAYIVNDKLTIGAAIRLGFPIGANVPDHATLGPAFLARVRYSVVPNVRLLGEIGYGIMRATIPLDGQPAGMNTDVVAEGPLLIGGGVGFKLPLGRGFAVVADLDALVGIATSTTSGGALNSPALNGGVGVDASAGVQVGF